MAAGKSNTATRAPQQPAAQQQQQHDADDAFVAGGTVRELAEPWRAEEPGEAMMGRLVEINMIKTRHTKGNEPDTPLAIFAAPVVRGKDGKLTAYGSLCLALGAGLRIRIKREDVGKTFALRYDGEIDTGKGNAAAQYTVVEQSEARHREMIAAAGASDDDLSF